MSDENESAPKPLGLAEIGRMSRALKTGPEVRDVDKAYWDAKDNMTRMSFAKGQSPAVTAGELVRAGLLDADEPRTVIAVETYNAASKDESFAARVMSPEGVRALAGEMGSALGEAGHTRAQARMRAHETSKSPNSRVLAETLEDFAESSMDMPGGLYKKLLTGAIQLGEGQYRQSLLVAEKEKSKNDPVR